MWLFRNRPDPLVVNVARAPEWRRYIVRIIMQGTR